MSELTPEELNHIVMKTRLFKNDYIAQLLVPRLAEQGYHITPIQPTEEQIEAAAKAILKSDEGDDEHLPYHTNRQWYYDAALSALTAKATHKEPQDPTSCMECVHMFHVDGVVSYCSKDKTLDVGRILEGERHTDCPLKGV